MGVWDKVKIAASEVKAAAIVAKAEHDTRSAGYNPDDYAGFNGEGLQAPTERRSDDERR